MKRAEESPEGQSLVERGLNWDIGFNRKLGVVALVAAGGISVAGAPFLGAKLAMFAGASFAVAEIEKRFVSSIEKH